MPKNRHPIQLEQHTVSDLASGYSRPIHLLRGPANPAQRLCLFLDGELYLQKMDVLSELQSMLDHGTLPPVTFAFIGHVNMKAREHDYTCNDPFGRFVVEKVLPYLETEIPGLQPRQHLIAGLSLSGLASTWLALQYPQHFPDCLSQSGSYWWKDQYLAKTAPQRVSAAALSKSRFWLSVGDQETEVDEPSEVSQVEGVKTAHQVLEKLGATVHYHEYHGGHDLKHWRAELPQALAWLLENKKS